MGRSNRELYEQHLEKRRRQEEASHPSSPQELRKQEQSQKDPERKEKKVRISFGKSSAEERKTSIAPKKKTQAVAAASPSEAESAEKTPRKTVSPAESAEAPPLSEVVKKVAEKTPAPTKSTPKELPHIEPRGKVPPKKTTIAKKPTAAPQKTVSPSPAMARFQKRELPAKPKITPLRKPAEAEAKAKLEVKPERKTAPSRKLPTSSPQEKKQTKVKIAAIPPLKKTQNTAKEVPLQSAPPKPAPSQKKTAPPHKKKVSRPKRKRFAKGPMIALVIVLVIAAGAFGVWKLLPQLNLGAEQKEATTVKETVYGASFTLGSKTIKKTTNQSAENFALKNTVMASGDAYMLPVSGLKDALDLDTSLNSDGTVATISNGAAKLVVQNDTLDASINGTAQKLSGIPFLEQGELYVAATDIAAAFNFQVEENEGSNSVSLFRAEAPKDTPHVWFSTDKETYTPGETVKYAVMSAKSNDPLVEYRWENKQDRFFTAGEYTITLQAKDIFGQWSDVMERKINVSGNAYSGAAKVPVLMYHFFTDTESDTKEGGQYYGNGAIMWTGQFREQMQYLKDNGYQTLFVSDLMSYLDNGQAPPPKSVVVICDDGYENNYELAYPIWKELGVKANIAVIVSASKSKYLADVDDGESHSLSFNQMQEMIDSGFVEIGSHTYNGHVYYEPYSGSEGFFFMQPSFRSDYGRTETTDEYRNRVINDLARSKSVLYEELGIEHPFFVYPYGRTNSFIQSTVKSLGYSSAFVIRDQYATAGVNTFEIPRFSMKPSMTMEEFQRIVGAGA